MKLVAASLGIAAVAGVTGVVLIYAGLFNVAADGPHSAFVYEVLQTVRDRSIAVRARRIQVPALDTPELIAEGARDYSDICVGCNLAPGFEESELRQGLYPKPPKLTEHLNASPAEMFWVIKHDIKMSAMPAWGPTHEDARIWSMVAFLRKLPDLSRDQYQALTTANANHDHHHAHHHTTNIAPVSDSPARNQVSPSA